MREIRIAQASIFENYSEHEFGTRLKALSNRLDQHLEILLLVAGAMGVTSKTFTQLRNFRAGVEGNISELKRAFGATKANWKGFDGFKAYVWSSVLSYNLMRLARLDSG